MSAPRDLLRFVTAGSVDDGKSTLIGRLLHDSSAIYEDQLASIKRASAGGQVDFSLLTDGLRAEREQGITIDVAYRYFSTPRREFIIADSPGHEQYTRNMATAASTANLAVILIDARHGILPQTHRHTAICWLLGIRSFAIAVNKMDLVGFDQQVFQTLAREFSEFAARLGPLETHFFPVCAIDGDNIVECSPRTPWFTRNTLLEHLEAVSVASARDLDRLRFPVQFVTRSDGSRRYTGQICSGLLRAGDRVTALPSGRQTRIASIRLGDDELDSASPPLSVSLALADDIDISRGDMLVDPDHPPLITRRLQATLLWMDEQRLQVGRPYLIKHTTRQVCASVTRVLARLDPAAMTRHPADALAFNEFGEVEIESHQPLYLDSYADNRTTGAFVVIDPIANGTLAAGMILGESPIDASAKEVASPTATGTVVWLTGLSSAGKSTIAKAVYEKLWARGLKVEWLDGDVVRQSLNRDLGFSKEDRDENIRRVGFVAELLARNGVIVLVSAISPYRSVRREMRARIGNFIEVYVHAPLEVCEQRDLKGIYRRVRAGEIHGVTGVDDPYEAPESPEVECRTDWETLAESVAKVLGALEHGRDHNLA